MVGLEPCPYLPPQLGLAVPAEPLAILARPLDLGEVAVVRLEDVVVLSKDRTDVRVRPEPALLLNRRAATREGVHDLLLGLGLRVRREDARLRNRGGHLARRSEEAREELGVDQGGLRITELRCHVPSDSEVRILVDTAGDEDRDVATCLYGRQERGRGLEARVEDLADVVRVLEPEDCLRRREGDPFRDFHRDRVQVPDVLRIEEDPRELRVESHRDDVQDVVVPDLRGLLEVVEILEEELLVVRDLEVQHGPELLLDPFREEPREHVANVNAARRTAARVEGELISPLETVQDPIQVPMTVENATAEHWMQVARYPPEAVQQFRRYPLGSELGDQAIIVD